MGLQILPEENPAEDGANRAIQRSDGNDDPGVACRRSGIERNNVGYRGKRPADGRTKHHDEARPRFHRLPEIPELSIFRANDKRPNRTG